MAQTITPKTPATVHCVVTRALCIGGVRQEVGTLVELTTAQHTDCLAAGKVGPVVSKPADASKPAAAKATKPAAAKATKPAAAKATKPAKPAAADQAE